MEMSGRSRAFALCVLALLVVLSGIQPSFAIDAEELQALQAIVAHYPALEAIWGPLTLDICNPTGFTGIGCADGHIQALTTAWFGSPSQPTAPLGNITGLRYITTLSLQKPTPIPDHDAWYSQLPSLYTIYITPDRPLMETCKLDFSKNPKLQTLAITDHTDGAQFTHQISDIPSLQTLSLSLKYANQYAANVLARLTSVKTLSLVAQQGGDFPSYTHMTEVETLIIDAPGMVSLPSTLGNMAKLAAFTCQNCRSLTKLPVSVSSLSRLFKLECDGAKLNQPDSIPDLSGTALSVLSLKRNGIVTLTGLCPLPLPGIALYGLVFSLDDNPLTSLPSCWANNNKMHWLSLDRTKFTSFPAVIATFPNLRTLSMLDVYTLGQSGASLPDFSAVTRLEKIDLTNCGLSGAFPSSSLMSNSATTIRLSGNRLTGELPTGFFNRTTSVLTGLTEFAIAGNSLSGPFPPFYPGCKLTALLIGGNKFTFYDPSIKNCSDITTLDVSGNEWTNLPQVEELANSFLALRSLNVSFNPSLTEIDSRVPQFLWGFNHYLTVFNGSGCGYSGDLSGITSRIQVLDLSYNNLSGPISLISTLDKVSTLVLSNNQLTGTLPDEWSSYRFPARLHLDISYNLLTGNIPTPGSYWNELQVFKASHNNLTGPISSRLPPSLRTFWVDGNSLDMCPVDPSASMPVLQSCRMEGENQRIDDCECSDFYFRRQCTLNTDCIPPPIDPPVDPPTPVDPGPPPYPGTPITPEAAPISPETPSSPSTPRAPSATSPSASYASSSAVSSVMIAFVAIYPFFFM